MGAVINATFGSIIPYGIALTQSKGHLVEGSIVGSLLAGVLLMPRMLLIVAFIGTIAPMLFYQTYGSVSALFVSESRTRTLIASAGSPSSSDGCPDGTSLT